MTEQGPKTKVDELREVLKAKKEAEAAATEKRGDEPTELLPDELPSEPDPDVNAQLRAAEEEAKAHYDKLLRVMAEFENFRRRTEREKDDAIKFANERLLTELLPVLDHLDEALANVETETNGSETLRSFCEGIELTRRQFLSVVAKFGLEPIEAEAGGWFDPTVHEAMAHVDAEGIAPGAVVARYRRGYRLHGRMLRAALVSVAK